MQFFKKHKEGASEAPETPTPTPEVAPNANMEEVARAWWAKHLGGEIPQDIERWLSDLATSEARRLMLSSTLLNDRQEEQVNEAIRLANSKMQHISETISNLKRQEEWLQNYQRTWQAQKAHSQRLYEVNKHLAAAIDEEKRLERFETFEPIQGDFQHLSLLQQMGTTSRDEQIALGQAIDQVSARTADLDKEMDQLRSQFAETEKQMELANDQIESLCRILGAGVVLELTLRNTRQSSESLQEYQKALHHNAEETRTQASELDQLISQKKLQLQALDPHRRMLSQGGALVLRLQLLSETKKEIGQLSQQLEEGRIKQREENKVLGQVFQQYQRVVADIKDIKDELQQHRACIAGTTSYALQERAMREQTRHQMLLAAQATWKHIQIGFASIEDCRVRLTELSHKITYGKDTLEKVEHEVERLRTQCHDKEYALTVSKSESVVQLRSDLKEGISCTVCGAAHHPYHSDTMLEQNKLIDELRTEQQLLSQELTNKERLLKQLEQAQTENETALKESTRFMDFLTQQQKDFVDQWQMYASLDRSFADCSPSTNMDARTEMLRLLIQTTLRQASQAQEELDTYNNHQLAINQLNEQLAQKEQERANLDTRLGEVNTACHVLARQVEMFDNVRDEAQKRYHRLYTDIQQAITLHEWQQEWEQSTEALCQRITQMMDNWHRLHHEVELDEQQRRNVDARLTMMQEEDSFLDSCLQQIQLRQEQYEQMAAEDQRNYDRLMEVQKGESFHKDRYQALRQAHAALASKAEELARAEAETARLKGRMSHMQDAAKDIEERTAQLRYTLDLWIRRYNASHPPVQYEELESSFDSSTNWELIRKRIRHDHVEAASEQLMVDHLNQEIAAMQATASRCGANIHDLSEEHIKQELDLVQHDYMQAALMAARNQLQLERNAEVRRAEEREADNVRKMGERR